MPALQAFAAGHEGDAIRVVGVTMFYGDPAPNRKRMIALRAETGVTFPAYVASGPENHDAFRVRSLTTTILVSAGPIVDYGVGIRGGQRVLDEAERRQGGVAPGRG